jgi:hypothetical protein
MMTLKKSGIQPDFFVAVGFGLNNQTRGLFKQVIVEADRSAG